MIRILHRTASFAAICTASMVFAAFAVVGSAHIAKAQVAGGPFCGPFYYPLVNPCSQGVCANPMANCTPDTQIVNGQPTAVCLCVVNMIMMPVPM